MRERVTAQLIRTLRRPCLDGCGCSKTLVSNPLTEERRHHLIVLVIYFYLFKWFIYCFTTLPFKFLSQVDLPWDLHSLPFFLSFASPEEVEGGG